MAVAYSVDPVVFDKVPGYRRIVLLAKGVVNAPSNASLELVLRSRITKTADDKITVADPKIDGWWTAYRAVGIKGDKAKVQPGVAALLRRITKGQGDGVRRSPKSPD
jgi:DNA/RNA-binding domain of Phe-tRNA-synthetase-like protein